MSLEQFIDLLNAEIEKDPRYSEGLKVTEMKPSLQYGYSLALDPTVDSTLQDKIIKDAVAKVSSRYEFSKA